MLTATSIGDLLTVGRHSSGARWDGSEERALEGWIAGDENEKIRNRAAAAYAKYQKCSLQAAHRLLTPGW
jgi:hypothetical protein